MNQFIYLSAEYWHWESANWTVRCSHQPWSFWRDTQAPMLTWDVSLNYNCYSRHYFFDASITHLFLTGDDEFNDSDHVANGNVDNIEENSIITNENNVPCRSSPESPVMQQLQSIQMSLPKNLGVLVQKALNNLKDNDKQKIRDWESSVQWIEDRVPSWNVPMNISLCESSLRIALVLKSNEFNSLNASDVKFLVGIFIG